MPVSSLRRLTLVAAATVATIAASASPVMASGVSGCPAAATSNPFAAWGDDADYQIAPGGDVEDAGASWSLTRGARAAKGNETYMASSPADRLSLRLPAAGTATTARMCVGVEHPSFRFFAKRTSANASSSLLVEVLYSDASGRDVVLPAGVVSGSDAWTPSQALPTMVEQIGATEGNPVSISFRFRPQGGGMWSIDDVFVDPHRLP